jgi:glutamyl-tRNA reductase
VDDLTQVVIDRIFYDVIKNLRKAAEQDDSLTIKAAEKIFSSK